MLNVGGQARVSVPGVPIKLRVGDAVAFLAVSGVKPARIRQILGISIGSVHKAIYSARQRGETIPASHRRTK